MEDFHIRKNVPIPPQARGRAVPKYPWSELEVNDSVILKTLRDAITGCMWAKRHGRKFVIRKQSPLGFGVWRVE